MSKRKQRREDSDNSDDEGSDVDIVNVDFEFFDPNPSVDYHAIKRLLIQLFESDAELLHVSDLTDLILSQPTVGTTIKTDGIESDPLALLTVLNMHAHHNHPSIKALADYILQKSSSDHVFHETLQGLLGHSALSQGLNASKQVGVVICERLINMPVQVVPPMYRMLTDEIKWAVADNEPYVFSHLLYISRIYRLSPNDEVTPQPQTSSASRSKRPRRQDDASPAPTAPPDGIYLFHPEDDQIKQVALHSLTYSFSGKQQPREQDAFGLDTGGRIVLVPADRLTDLVARVTEAYAVA